MIKFIPKMRPIKYGKSWSRRERMRKIKNIFKDYSFE